MPRSLTVAFVNATRKWGGVKTWTLDFGAELARRGHRIVAIVRGGTPFEDACRAAGFQVHALQFGMKYNPAAIRSTARIFRTEGTQVVVVNISRDVEVGGAAAWLCRLPVLHRVGLVEDYRGTWEERLRHRLLVDRVLVPAQWMRAELLRRFHWLAAAHTHALANSKPLGRYPRAGGSGGDAVVFGVASQLSPSKGHAHLLQALARARGSGNPVRLRVAGAGHLEQDLRRQARELGVADAVSWEGFLADVPAFLSELDAFVLASLKEGFPNTLLEAMCVGLPVLSSDLPGAREMLGGAGLLVPAGDAGALAEGIQRLAGDADLRRRLGSAARERAEQRFDVTKNAARLESLLLAMAGRDAR